MVKKIIGFDLDRTPSPQLQSVARTLRETLKKYPNAKIDMYRHSLASMNVQYTVASKMKLIHLLSTLAHL